LKKALVFCFYCFTSLAIAQLQKQISFSQLSVNEGLSQNSVVSIAQDGTGYLWFATQDGLNRYDGRKFTYYQKLFEDITKENYSKLGKLYLDKEQQLYIITKDEIVEKYDPRADTFRKIKKFKNASVLFQDSYLNTWVGTYGNGLYVFNKNDTLQLLNSTDIIKGVFSLSEYNDKVIVTASEAVFEVDPISFHYTKFPISSNNETINFSAIATDNYNGLWIGSYGSGLFFKNESETPLKQFSGFDAINKLPDNLNIQALLFDSKERLWVCTYGSGAFLIDFISKKISQFKAQQFNPKALHYNDVLCAFEDFTKTIWLGTDGGGLSYYDENLAKFNSMTNASIPGFADVAVTRAIAIDLDGSFWIGTSGKGLTYYNPRSNQFKAYKHDPNSPGSIRSNRIMSLLSEKDRLWIGFQDDGLAILQNNTFKNFNETSTPALNAQTVWCIYKDRKDRYWIGTRDNGLLQFDPVLGVLKNYTYDKEDKNSISSNNIRVITEGKSGELWIGTENNGLNKLLVKEGGFTRYTSDNISSIKSLYYTNEKLWIGTNGKGLQSLNFKTSELKGYTVSDGLPNNVIYAILPDANHDLWLSSNRGITKFSEATPGGKIEIVNYDTYDGLQALEFNTGASFKDHKETLYFGGLNGINWFRPSRLSNNPVPPKTIITKLEIFDEEASLHERPVYNSRQNTMTFYFAGLHFSQPERNQYKYKLSNYDQDWSRPNTEGYARYMKLPPGDYEFSVVSSNYDGVWDPSPVSYAFTINPPWYLSIWAKIAYVLGLLFILFSIYKYLKWRWQMQVRLQLEHNETERLIKLDELKSKLYTNISHEFRTPLTLISGPVQQLISNSAISENDKSALHIIESSSQRMLRLVNQLLELSKLETGEVKLQVSNHDLNAQVAQIKEVFEHQAHEKGISIKDSISLFSESWYDKDILEKVLFNLISNAIKYAPENSDVFFSATEEGGYLQITIENSNETLKSDDMHKLFDRFYQVDKNLEGVGIGLSLIKELVTLSHGRIKVEKTSAKNILFKILIPIARELYQEAEFLKDNSYPEPIETQIPNLLLVNPKDPPQLLIVEDNEEVRRYIVSLFADFCEILEASDGLEGIHKAIEYVPDLIISDIMMPVKDGIELCNTLKNDTRTCHIPIILVTAKSGDTNELKGLQSKADDYITKPFNAEIVKQKVINCINGRRELQKRYSQNVYLKSKDIAVSDLDEEFLEKVQDIIDNKLMQPDFSAVDFSKELSLSRMQLHRKLKALTGLSTTEFIRSQRLKSAVKLLETTSLTVSEIAYTVGFNTPSYFTKCFKEAYKATPADYAKSL
jgi:signal transduction histidine kinase/ligand-binding sensor domain-containing protein/CheY-like chemotaxis protein/AraC-like DNA-binding protein